MDDKILRPNIVRRALLDRAALAPADYEPNPKLRGALVGHINKALDNGIDKVDERRHMLLGWLFCPDPLTPEPMSSNDLNALQLWALQRWIGSKKVDDEWVERPTFGAECRWVSAWALFDFSRLKTNPDMTMLDLLEFWKKAKDISPDDEVARAASFIGGIITEDPEAYPALEAVGGKRNYPEAIPPGSGKVWKEDPVQLVQESLDLLRGADPDLNNNPPLWEGETPDKKGQNDFVPIEEDLPPL